MTGSPLWSSVFALVITGPGFALPSLRHQLHWLVCEQKIRSHGPCDVSVFRSQKTPSLPSICPSDGPFAPTNALAFLGQFAHKQDSPVQKSKAITKAAPAPQKGSRQEDMMKRWIGKTWLKVNGWRVAESPPEFDKYVLIAAPHTSNWDLPYMMAYAWIHDMKISWMGKHTLFYPPYGWFMRWLGGRPIERSSAHGVVHQTADQFKKATKLILAVPASGTRSKKDYWKSGFYFIAQEADVPIIPSYLDFGNKVAGFGPPLYPSGDIPKDMDILRAFYADKNGLYPEKHSRIRLRIEDEWEEHLAKQKAEAQAAEAQATEAPQAESKPQDAPK